MSLIVLGTVAIDNIKTTTGWKRDLLGGSASHFCMSASLFSKVHLVSVVGDDFPKKHLNFLKKKGVDLTSLLEEEGKSFCWEGEYKKSDLNNAITISTELGVLLNYVPQVSVVHESLPYVFLANFDPDLQYQFLQRMTKPKLVGMDTMNLWLTIKRNSVLKLVKKVDLFIANDAEAKMLTKENNLIKAAKQIRKMGPKWVVIKKGEHGVYFHSDKFHFSFPAFPVENVLDPTGAGDTFAGGIMGYLVKHQKFDEKTFRNALTYATTLSSFNVEGFGMSKTAPLNLTKVNQRRKALIKFIAP